VTVRNRKRLGGRDQEEETRRKRAGGRDEEEETRRKRQGGRDEEEDQEEEMRRKCLNQQLVIYS